MSRPIMLLKSGLFFTLCLFTFHASQSEGKNQDWEDAFLIFFVGYFSVNKRMMFCASVSEMGSQASFI